MMFASFRFLLFAYKRVGGGVANNTHDRYTIEKEVGRGTFGRVLRCLDKHATSSEHEKVAVKVFMKAVSVYAISPIMSVCLRFLLVRFRTLTKTNSP